ncbi:MAG: hypothetical protein U5R06_06075 [candidate division KSB1 bacterium]|nr:hypothetical protein [candidate division KSB1 bacterium]
MRYYLYQQDHKDSLSMAIDSTMIDSIYENYSYQYKTRILKSPGGLSADSASPFISMTPKSVPFDSFCIDSIYSKTVSWSLNHQDKLTTEIFKTERKTGDLVGPVFIDSVFHYVKIVDKQYLPPLHNSVSMIKGQIKLDLCYCSFVTYINQRTAAANIEFVNENLTKVADIIYDNPKTRNNSPAFWREKTIIFLHNYYDVLYESLKLSSS